jgi:hypothetical protein
MSDQLQHDPRTKQQIKDMLYASLYEPVEKQFKKRIYDIVAKNTSLIGSSHESFIYKAEYYSNVQTKPPIKMNRLVMHLRPTMDEYIKDLKNLNDKELPYVLGFLNQVLNASDSLQDYMLLLPESMHQPLQKLIETCPCRKNNLTQEKIKALHDRNQQPIAMIKQRMVMNLIT